MDTDKSKHWNSFWKQGHITTFGDAQRDNYQGPIKNFWLEQYASTPAKASILDIATGNGALAQLAVEFSTDHQKQWAVHGCDLAQIQESPELRSNPRLATLRRTIQFHSDIACEALPFNDRSFDLVSSQFGFEYSDLGRSIPEVYRVTKTGGRFCAIFHHQDSVTSAASNKEIQVYQAALQEQEIFLAATRYLHARASDSTQLSVAKNALNSRVNTLLQQFPGDPCCKQIIGAMTGTMQQVVTTGVEKVVAKLALLEEDFSDAHQRLQDLASASLSDGQIPGLQEQFRAAGFTSITSGKVEFSDNQILGHSLIAKK